MTEFSRRRFLAQTSIGVGVAVAGVAAAPALPQLAPASVQPNTPARPVPDITLASPSLAGTMVIHVRDVATAELAVLVGTSEFVYRDPELVARVVQAASQSAGAEG